MTVLNREQADVVRKTVVEMVEDKAQFALTDLERESVRVVGTTRYDFEEVGLSLIDLTMHERYGGRLIVLLPNQVVFEHWHPDVDGAKGKVETFRVLWGEVDSFCEGEASDGAQSLIPAGSEDVFTARRRIHLAPGEQHTTQLHERHWLVAGDVGVVGLEFSSPVRDRSDIKTDIDLDLVFFDFASPERH